MTAEGHLLALQRKEFVRRQRHSSVAGETEFAFAHALVRDVAYGQIPRTPRLTKHRAAASWLESLGRPDDHAEMRAHHYLSALEPARAAGLETPISSSEATSLALREAGERASALYAYEAAVHHYDQGARALAGGR